MEREVFTLEAVKKEFAKFVLVSLKTDIKDKRADELFAKFKDAEDPTIPYYVVFDHDVKPLGGIHATLGPEPDGNEANGPAPSAFVKFLATMSAKNVTGDKPIVTPKAEMKPAPAPAPTVTAEKDLLSFFLFAFGAGLLTLLTPCVLPVLPLTIGFFVKQAEQKRPPLITAGIYCGVILVSFTSIGVLASVAMGASGGRDIAASWWLNSAFGVLFIVLALSFLGMFELRLPSFLTMKTSQAQFQANKSGQGYVAAAISGTSFTLISFSCTGPFAALVLSQAATGDLLLPTLGMLTYASGLAMPIFIMGQFPAMIKKLPKSGSWMNAIKVVFGFIELALALSYLGQAELAFSGAPPTIFSKDIVVVTWVACAAASGLYLFGLFRLPHDHEKLEQVGVVRAMFGVLFFAVAVYMLPMVFGGPLGNLAAVIPPGPKDAPSAFRTGDAGGGVSHKPHFEHIADALAEAKKTRQPVFIDFTGPA